MTNFREIRASMMSRLVDAENIKIGSARRGDLVEHAVLAVIVFVGFCVLLGWHIHSGLLVQVMPGVIPMQYNTALCFIVLGVTGMLLLKRARSWATVPGAAFLVVMGALVIYQYATEVSLGIDTLFFYPWDLTLLKYPGRMALTSAVSFFSAGIAIFLLSLRRHALAAFAILNTLPMSLGLTSGLGYLAGITFVLPFQLGSQMAMHTAFAFFTYGLVMLIYAWREAPHTEHGIPKWTPAIGILMLPILFVGIGMTAQHRSILGWIVPLFIGLLAAVLFAIAAYNLTRSRINQKGLLLVSVPLVFVLIFLVFVSKISQKSEQAHNSYLHSQQLISEIDDIFADLVDAEAGMRGYVITGNIGFASPYHQARRNQPQAWQGLQDLVKDDPIQQAKVTEFRVRTSAKMFSLANTEELMRTGLQAQAVDIAKSGEGVQLMNEVRRVKEELLSQEQHREIQRQDAVQNAWQQLNWLLVAGSAIDIFLAVILALLFSGGISRRIVALTENAKALADGRSLVNGPMKGTDEIAHLDHVFRDMAKALREAAGKERAIFENALDIICSTDAQGTFLKMSPSSLRIWGYRPEEMIGRPLTEFLAPEEIERTMEATRTVVASGTLTDFENRYRRKDGSIAHMLWSAWWSEADQVVIAMARDITERKRAEAVIRESEERYRLLFEGNPHPIWVFDLETLRFLAVNPAAIQTYGHSREEFLGMTIKDIRPSEDIPALLENVSRVGSGIVDRRTWRHRKKDGSIIDVEIASHQLIFSGRKAEIVLANDVTARQQAETEVKQLNQNLEKRTIQLEETNKELKSFSYSVSHDLRAPLRAIDGFSRILLEDYADKLDADGNRLLDVVRKNAQSMGQLIDDLLAFSRLGRKTVEPSVINMTDLAQSVVEELNTSESTSKPEFRIRDIPPALGDRALIRQVFVNLLSNAKKYSCMKETALIEIGGDTKNGDHVYYVKDNGAGFDMQYANKLFGVFQRLHGPEEFEGTGVGLAIVQRIVQRHGGRVWAEGKVNQGATFYFSLPKESQSNGKAAKHE